MIRELLFALGAGAAMAVNAADVAVVSGLAADWAESYASQAIARGTPLSDAQATLARQVGVRDPSKVRIRVVDELPAPQDPVLVAAAGRIGLMPQAASGMTLGYAVLLKRGAEKDARLLSHELRHVAQYEEKGGIRPFLTVHIPQLMQFGYEDSPFERDARAHEIGPRPAPG
jgi:hypothetical protein